MMAILFVTYAAREGARFDRDYYVDQHLPLAEREWAPWGLRAARAFFPARDARHLAVAILEFDEPSSIASALASPATERVLGNLPNFTDVEPHLAKGVAP